MLLLEVKELYNSKIEHTKNLSSSDGGFFFIKEAVNDFGSL
jgi:hypothetical protein